MENFNKQTFIVSTVFVGLLLIPSFLAAWAYDEGTLGDNLILVSLSRFFHVLRFPTHILFWELFSGNGLLFLGGLLLNCIFYGLAIERVVFLFKHFRAKR